MPVTARADSILTNGGFELGPPVPTNDIEMPAGSTAILGGLATGTSIDYLGSPWDALRACTLSTWMGGTQLSAASSKPLEPSGACSTLVSFGLSGNPQGGPSVKRVRVGVEDFGQDYTDDSRNGVGRRGSEERSVRVGRLSYRPIGYSRLFVQVGTRVRDLQRLYQVNPADVSTRIVEKTTLRQIRDPRYCGTCTRRCCLRRTRRENVTASPELNPRLRAAMTR